MNCPLNILKIEKETWLKFRARFAGKTYSP